MWLTNTPQYPEASYQVATQSGCYVAPKEDTSIKTKKQANKKNTTVCIQITTIITTMS